MVFGIPLNMKTFSCWAFALSCVTSAFRHLSKAQHTLPAFSMVLLPFIPTLLAQGLFSQLSSENG